MSFRARLVPSGALLRWETSHSTRGNHTRPPITFPRQHRASALRRLLCVLLLVLAACGGNTVDRTPGKSEGFKAITSTDGALQFRVPESWAPSELNPVAALQAGDPEAEAYGVVIEDPRKVLQSYSLAKFADLQMQELVTTIQLASLAGPTKVKVDGQDALQYRLKGFFDSVEVVYLYTFVETPDRFLKVVTWSLADRFDDNKEVMEQVSTSVRQLKALPEPTPGAGVADPAVVPTQQGPGAFDRDPNA
jgi:hypothetical protein